MSRPKGSQVGAEWVRGASGNRECQGASWSQILKDVGDWGLLGEWGHLPLLLWPCTFSVCVLQASCWASHCPGLPPLPAASSPHPAPSSTHRRHWLPSSVYHLHGPLGPPGAQKPPPPVPMLNGKFNGRLHQVLGLIITSIHHFVLVEHVYSQPTKASA